MYFCYSLNKVSILWQLPSRKFSQQKAINKNMGVNYCVKS